MKNLILFLLLIILSGYCIETKAQISSAASGNWNDINSWVGGVVPISSNNVFILDSHVITVSSAQNCKELTINTGGTLMIQASSNLTTSQSINLSGTLNMDAGVLNVGDKNTDVFDISSGILNFSGGTINVAGRYKQYNSSNIYLSGDAILNISTYGVQTVTGSNNFYVGSGIFSVISSSTVQIVLKNGNTTTKEEIYYSPATSNFDGGSFIIENASGDSDIYIDSDMPLYDIESNVGLGNVLHFNYGSDFSMNNLTITSGNIQLDAGAQIDITGTANLGLDDKLLLQSNETSSASVIFNTAPSNTVSVQRYFTSGEWHLFGVPFSGITAEDMYIDSVATWMTWFDEGLGDSGSWDYITAIETALSLNEGFMYFIDSTATNQTINYTGSLIVSDQTFTLSKDKMGWNALSNPYSCALDWDIGTWDKTNTTEAAYVWDDSQNGYLVTNGGGVGNLSGGIIPMGQGFFVQANTAGNFTIPIDARVHSPQDYYKETEESFEDDEPSQYIQLDLNDGMFGNTVFIGFPENGTEGFDNGKDATKLFSSAEEVQLFVKENENKLCINANAPLSQEGKTVPLNIIQITDGNYTLKLSDISQLPETNIVLEDTKTGQMQDLISDSIYYFIANSSDIPERLRLHFMLSPNAIGENIEQYEESRIYSYGSDIYVENKSENEANMDVFIYDLMGREIYFQNNISEGLNKINLPIKNSFVIVKVVTNGMISTKKVFIK